jgi:all-trans-retinol 13,14-reductase
MKNGTPYKQAALENAYDTIVIGSGMGGLATASLLARHARERVLVLERHYTAGGFTHAFERPGWDWDVGVHYIGEVHSERSLARRLFDHLTDGQLEWADLGEVYDTIKFGDARFELKRGGRQLETSLIEAFPAEADGIRGYFREVRRAAKSSQLFFADRVLPARAARVLGPVLRARGLRYARKTTRSVVDGLVSDPLLRGILTAQWGDYGLPPRASSFLMHAMVVSHFLRGAAYPVGGASRIAETIIPSIERSGGAVITRAEVKQIVLEHGRAVGVRLHDDRVIRAQRIVSDAGAATTFGKLLPASLRPAALRVHREAPASQHAQEPLSPSVAHLSLYVGFTRSAAELKLPKHNIWCYEYTDHDEAFERSYGADQPLLVGSLISCASARDPDYARRHPGRSTAEVVTLVPYSWFREFEQSRWKHRGKSYEELKAELVKQMRAILVRELPQVEGAIGHLELSTPLSTEHFAGHPDGAIYGVEHSPARFEASWMRPRTEVPQLFLTGADACVAGVVGALMGGVLSTAAILGSDPRMLLRMASGGAPVRATLGSVAPSVPAVSR